MLSYEKQFWFAPLLLETKKGNPQTKEVGIGARLSQCLELDALYFRYRCCISASQEEQLQHTDQKYMRAAFGDSVCSLKACCMGKEFSGAMTELVAWP